ncbi:putative transcription factor & lipid binding HD-SAD family [Helianthus annuus]|uniref:Putative START domain, Homeodomain-like, MEKHLA, START-like domain protein n=1 Tax=Helianthus annuus TaxID=4232 RepID=A0A251SJR0_HELAN|nr:homeobox-leucine zipper protein REVOLUTA [Helianthus annuus]KAF5770188.1 putative transcription factor & lipid binding HD-SAD family [Helianthus annuus]
MAMVVQHQQQRETSSSSSSMKQQQHQHQLDNGKYVRYTAEQVEALERVYAECPKPSSLKRQQLIRECPILSNIEPKQIKVWFQNRRCREKQRKEASRLQMVNRKLSAMNKLLMEENDRLQKQVSQLVYENGYMRQQLHTASAVTDASCESAVTTPQHSLRDANNPAGLLSIAEETLTEFLSKATGTAVDWVQMPGMKPGPDSVGIFAISQSCSGVAARACGLVSLEPTKIVEILKDRTSWFRDCRNLEVLTMLPAGNGGTIELVYTQVYAPTTLAPARDFWTLRYTTSLENGSLVVCERSLSGSGGGPNAAAAAQFVRGEMLPSGYLIRPCDGGGSIIHIVDHLNFEPWSAPEVIRPLYESSKVVAQKMTIAALRYIRQIAQESSGEVVYGLGRQPAILRTLSQRLSRGFNDAINGFNDDGWSLMNCDGAEDVIVSINSTKNIGNSTNSSNPLSFLGGVLCAKASMLFHNVPPAVLVRFLREHRSEWADFNVDAYSAASVKASPYGYQGTRPTRFTGSQIIMPLGQTIEHEEMLEVIRLEGHAVGQEDPFVSRDIHLLQLCSGIDENAVGACSELVFAPIDEMFPDDAPLIPSGFRIIPLDPKSGDPKDAIGTTHRTLDLTSSLEVGQSTNHGPSDSMRSVLTIAFQFPFENNLADSVATMARQYVRSVINSVQRVAMAISPSGLSPSVAPKLSPSSPEALTLAQWICHSYTYYLGTELLTSGSVVGDSLLKDLWQHQDATLCCSLKSLPVFIFANQAGLDMLETTLVALQDITLDKMFDEAGRKALFPEFAKIMQEGYAYLPGGICMSTMGRHISYEQAIAWKVLAGDETTVHCLAFSFVNWSFV